MQLFNEMRLTETEEMISILKLEHGELDSTKGLNFIIDIMLSRGKIASTVEFQSVIKTDDEVGKKYLGISMFWVKWDEEDVLAILMTDITLQKEIISLQVADANKEKVIASISHEIRTPINAM